jgi:O-antigen/teichoic acid export membrane protein
MKSELVSNILKGTLWTGFQTFINGSFTFLVNLVLAKLLLPESFGLIGMSMVVIGVLQSLNEFGIAAALVQKRDNEINQSHFDTAFTTGLFWSFCIYGLLYFCTHLIVDFYNEPQLGGIIPLLSLTILFNALIVIPNADLTRKLEFRKLAILSNISRITSGLVAIVLALLGFGVWSLVANAVLVPIIALPFYWRFSTWRPRFYWDRSAFKEIFGFGAYYTGTSVINTVVSKLDFLVIGRILTANALGVYSLGLLLSDTLRAQIMTVTNKVMYPIYGKIQDDRQKAGKYYLNVVKYNSVLVYPFMGFFILFSKEFIDWTYGSSWYEVVPVLRILAFSVIFHMMVNSNTSLIRGIGKPKLEMKIQLFKAIFIYFPSIYIGASFFGLIGAAWAIVVNKFLSVFIAQYFLKRLFNISFKDLMISLRVPLQALILSMLVAGSTHKLLNINVLMVVSAYFLIYGLVTYSSLKNELLTLKKTFKLT